MTATTTFPILIRAQFKRWLERKRPTDIAGETGQFCDCPLARYLHETYGGRWEIGGLSYARHTGTLTESYYLTPMWAQMFIERFDRLEYDGTPIIVARALAVLESVPA